MHAQIDASPLFGSQAFECGGDIVLARVQRRGGVEAGGVGRQIQVNIGRLLNNLDTSTTDHGAGRVGDYAGNGAGIDLRERGAAEYCR